MEWLNGWYIGLYFTLIFFIFLSIGLKNRKILGIFICILILFSGFRYGAGIDFFIYEHLVLEGMDYELQRIEPLSRLLMVVSKYFDVSFLFFLSTSFLYMYSIVIGLKRFDSYSAFTIYMFTLFTLSFLSSFGFVRQFVATGILFVAFSYLFRGKSKRFILVSLLATLFHYSSIVYVLFYFIRYFIQRNFKFWVYVLLIIAGLLSTELISFLIIKIGFYAHYFLFYSDGEVAGVKIYYSLLLVSLSILFVETFFVNKKKINTLLSYSKNMVFISLFMYSALLPFGEKFVRISYYLIPFYYVWAYQIYKGISSKEVKIIYLLFIVLICSFYYFSTLYFAQFSSRGDFLNNFRLNF
ncbi:EpsG-like putative glucosyltransferase [Balneicella halophila]|uniref:EpsG-like putative glucosyltransferase n=1 Tax=Balneicella halophila TaxID=1537566 RepID=A0A7L4UNS3_BALHA|nr:EpsG family protein [Balneicella halophila]PVX50751.1 EpsG-like putative glucosyltransferase [Balneicella halophila]